MDPLNNQKKVEQPAKVNTEYQKNMPGNMSATPTEHKKVGPIVATLIIVIVLVVAALYLFASYINKQPSTTANQTTDEAVVANQTVPQVTGISDDPQSIQNDLDNSLQGVDAQSF